jgi:ADP-ribosyl-[dinitrogen reductase] hydrolase
VHLTRILWDVTDLDLSAALSTALEAVAAARMILLAECARAEGPRGEIGHCVADDEAEWAIRERLLTAFPDWGYLGEETGARARAEGADCVWIVDPNDGTRAMQRGYRGHAVSVGLVQRGVPVLGVVCAVNAPDDRGDLVAWAEGCGPIQRNGLPLEPVTWADRLGTEEVVCLSLGANRNPVGNLAAVTPARFLGMPSIAYRLALVAVGECTAAVSLQHLSAWDFAAGHALVRAAGGVVVDEGGREISYAADGQSRCLRIFAGGRGVVAELVSRAWERASGGGFGESAPPPTLAPVRAQPGTLIHHANVLRRAHGCVLGQVAGDALGALVEFQSADEIARRYSDGGPHRLATGGPHRIMAGQPTDDSELALALARSLVVEPDGFNQEASAAAYARWFHGWTHAEQPETCTHRWCRPFDVGGTTAQALGPITADDIRQGQAASRARKSANPHSQANGALMRVSPLGIWGALRDPAEVAAAARQDAQLTHPHPVCQDASALFAVTIAAAIGQGMDPRQTYDYAVEWSRIEDLESGVRRALEAAEDGPPADFLHQQGWVLTALHNAFFELLDAKDMQEAVVRTVRRGGDTDTNAAICGALLGAVYGRDAIPSQWQRMVLSCRPMPGLSAVMQPRPAMYWPVDGLVLAERLVASGRAARD